MMEIMDVLQLTFPVSGVTCRAFVPPLVAFVVSFFTSMAGVSGAFVLLPFQMSFLGYTSPSVSATNQVYNIVAIPSGVWRYMKEKRMVWPLTWTVILGTLPGVFIGAWIRIQYLPDPTAFKLFAAVVLLYLGIKLFADIRKTGKGKNREKSSSSMPAGLTIRDPFFSLTQAGFCFGEQCYSFSVPGVIFLCFIVGIIGGIYGIGGGAIIAPFFVSFFHLPVYAVAGAALMGTLVTSIAGVLTYHLLDFLYPHLNVAPDWFLGVLFGVGGFSGMYLGARCQKNLPGNVIKLILGLCVIFVACRYVYDFIQ